MQAQRPALLLLMQPRACTSNASASFTRPEALHCYLKCGLGPRTHPHLHLRIMLVANWPVMPTKDACLTKQVKLNVCKRSSSTQARCWAQIHVAHMTKLQQVVARREQTQVSMVHACSACTDRRACLPSRQMMIVIAGSTLSCVRPHTSEQVTEHYNEKWRPTVHA